MSDQIEKGYYLKARCIKDSWIAHASPCVREVWDYLLREANHTDKKYMGYMVKRGQLFRSFSEIRDALKWRVGFRFERYSEDQMKHTMKMLRREGMITLTSTPRGNLITVLNYAKYQDPKNYEYTDEYHHEYTSRPPRVHREPLSINKNDKNKELKKEEIIFSELGSQGKEINDILHLFKQINPSINYGNKTQRQAVEWLIKEYGTEKAHNTVEYALSIQGQKYAPTITTPHQLKTRLGELIVYFKKNNNQIIDLSKIL